METLEKDVILRDNQKVGPRPLLVFLIAVALLPIELVKVGTMGVTVKVFGLYSEPFGIQGLLSD